MSLRSAFIMTLGLSIRLASWFKGIASLTEGVRAESY